MSFPDGFDPTRCVLFLGSGFSVSATNKRGKAPPIGNALRDAIFDELGAPRAETDLKDAAGFAHRRGLNLQTLLSELFTISDIDIVQEVILEKQWRRIYTTNYDDTVEFFEKKSKRNPSRKSFSMEDARPLRLPPDSVIHLHGFIHHCNKDNVLKQLVLDHRSYAEQAALESPWWDQLNRDFQGAQWIFFVGYALNDFAIARYLTTQKSISERVCFILRSPIDEFVSDRLGGYGSVYDFGVSGFSESCKVAITGAPINAFHELKAFTLLDPYKDGKSVSKPTPVEIEAFLSRGKYSFSSLSSTFPRSEFAIPRTKKIEEAIEKLSECRTLILHSKTANGKSIFADTLSLAVSQQGGTCVRYRSHTSIPPQELTFLSTVKDLIVFIPTYDDAVEIADDLRELAIHAKFVVEINTGTDQVRRTEVQGNLAKPIQRIDLNSINRTDVDDFSSLLDRAGLPSSEIIDKNYSARELRDLLLRLIQSPFVRKKIEAALAPIVSDREAMKVVAAICVLKSFGIHASSDYISAVTKEDPVDVLLRNEAAAAEFGEIFPNQISFHSSVFCSFFLREYIGGSGVSSVICRLAFEAARRKDDLDARKSQRSREARKALGALLQYANISPIFKGLKDSVKHITEIYETLRDNSRINAEPLFWLQYSIFMQDEGSYGLARKHLETAYIRAEQIDTFFTYQLDTNYLRLILQAPADEPSFPGDTDILFGLIDKVRAMITAEDHRVHALKVLEDIRLFSKRYGRGLTAGERQLLAIKCMGIIGDLDGLSIDIKTEFATEITKERVREAVSILADIV